jgi:hypothetical protein
MRDDLVEFFRAIFLEANYTVAYDGGCDCENDPGITCHRRKEYMQILERTATADAARRAGAGLAPLTFSHFFGVLEESALKAAVILRSLRAQA